MKSEIVHKKITEGTLIKLYNGDIGIVTKSRVDFNFERSHVGYDPWIYEVLVKGDKLELVRESFVILLE